MVKQKTQQTDKKIQEAADYLGMPVNSLRRIAVIEFLKSHFDMEIKVEEAE